VSTQPVRVFFREQREVVKLIAEFNPQFFIRRQRAQFRGAELVLLQFRQQRGEFLCEASAPHAAAKQFQFIHMA
jgi:hypothetical protein